MASTQSILKKINNFFKWGLICLMMGILIGSATALFLHALDLVTQYRIANDWIIYGLPIVGLFIGWIYYHWGQEVNKGNNLLLESHKNTSILIPFKMAPLVFIGTLLTHLVGGSSGREGTAVQMGGAIAAPFAKWFKLKELEKKSIIVLGISAGFAAVFGTPIAGAIFALEIVSFRKINYANIIPSFLVAWIAHYTCLYWGVQHSIYKVSATASINVQNLLYAVAAGLIFGLVALLFTQCTEFFKKIFSYIRYAPLRPFIGGFILLILFQIIDANKWMGLGIPTIAQSFEVSVSNYDFVMKLLLTSFTLSAGFKGGEVTPLFFIGATLGNILVVILPLPMALLAAMGFVAVFAGATHCVIASIVLGFELFGVPAGLFVSIACIVAYFSSGFDGIYSAQHKTGAKYELYNFVKRISSL